MLNCSLKSRSLECHVFGNENVTSRFDCREKMSKCQRAPPDFQSREWEKQIAAEEVNVFHCKVTPECHFRPRYRLLSVIPVAPLHSAYRIANSICQRRARDGQIVGPRSRSAKLQWPFVARGENQITGATMQTKGDLGREGASLLPRRADI